MKKEQQLTMFDDVKNTWQQEWRGMPEYINEKTIEPEQTAIFKFKSNEDFERFMKVVKKELYNDQRVFDGKQLKNLKSAWFPLPSRPSEHIYVLNEYPFQEGVEYWCVEGGEIIFSYWDDQSEEKHDQNPGKQYFKTEEEAKESINKNKKCRYCENDAETVSYRDNSGCVSKEFVCFECHHKSNP